MPKYFYHCNDCGDEWGEWHGMSESPANCPCGSMDFERLPSSFALKIEKRETQKRKVGEITKDFIEDSKEELRAYQQKLEERTYEHND